MFDNDELNECIEIISEKLSECADKYREKIEAIKAQRR